MVQVSRIRLVAFLSAAVFLVRTVAMMMGPVLVAVAAAFDTSVAATPQRSRELTLGCSIELTH